MLQKTIADLPEEMMIRIFKLLLPQDLENVMLVCKGWKEMGEDPTLWTWSRVTVKSREDFPKLNIRRFLLVQELKIGDNCSVDEGCHCQWAEDDWIELFELLVNLPGLNILNPSLCFWACSTNLSCVDTGLVLNVYKRLKKVCMHEQLSHEQSYQLFSAVAQNECSLEHLQIWGKDTIKLSPEIFASAVSNVEEVVLGTWNITHEQMEALFVALSKEGSRLKKLDLSSCNTDEVEPGLMGEAVNKLEEFEVANTWVKRDQIREILLKIVKGESKLNKLVLGDLSYREFGIEPALVRKVRDKFGKFYYFNTDYMIPDGEEYDPFENVEGNDLAESEDEGQSDENGESDNYSEYAMEVKRLSDIYIVD